MQDFYENNHLVLARLDIFLYLCNEITKSMRHRILVIDSDISLATILSDYLDSKGYYAQHVPTGKEALETLKNNHFDLILMEIEGLGMNGYDLLREIRHRNKILPIIILTKRNDRENQIRAFQLGCDDYQCKPFTMDILICRIEAILRRIHQREENKQRIFQIGEVTFDSIHQTFGGAHMSSRQSELLLLLCRNQNEIVDKHHILTALWKEDNAFTARSLGVYINHLRRFLSPVGYSIIAVRRKGYKLICNE